MAPPSDIRILVCFPFILKSELMVARQTDERKGQLGSLGWITNNDLLYYIWNSAHAMWQSGWEGSVDICICMAESLPQDSSLLRNA